MLWSINRTCDFQSNFLCHCSHGWTSRPCVLVIPWWPRTTHACRAALLCLINLLVKLGFAINWKKVISPTTRIQFLGLIIDSLADRVELPQDKLDKLVTIAREYALRTKLTKRELQVISGHMAFASRAIYGARPFTRLFIDAVNTLRRSNHKFRLGPVHKAELQWWTTFASTFNGLVLCALGRHRPVFIVRTDENRLLD